LFLGALPEDTPALYSLMNYADIKLGTWYPENGMYSIVDGMHQLATELGVEFLFDHDVVKINTIQDKATSIVCKLPNGATQLLEADVIVGSADYHFIETKLLDKAHQSYTDSYWNKRVMAPSCLLYYVGLNKKLKHVLHHTLFFDVSFDVHGKEIYTTPQWPTDPLFYVSMVSVTDLSSAPEGHENLFFLIPVSAGLKNDTEALREAYFEKILDRFEKRIGEKISDAIVYKRSYSVSNFMEDYNSFRGNAYGLANTLMQTAILKPSMRSKKIKNLFYTGQLTVPGPGVPPSLISGEVVAGQVDKYFK
jgi:phytoene desaturase